MLKKKKMPNPFLSFIPSFMWISNGLLGMIELLCQEITLNWDINWDIIGYRGCDRQ